MFCRESRIVRDSGDHAFPSFTVSEILRLLLRVLIVGYLIFSPITFHLLHNHFFFFYYVRVYLGRVAFLWNILITNMIV